MNREVDGEHLKKNVTQNVAFDVRVIMFFPVQQKVF